MQTVSLAVAWQTWPSPRTGPPSHQPPKGLLRARISSRLSIAVKLQFCCGGTLLSLDKCSSLQTRGEAAASQLILYHYPELKEEKGIVLMTAEMDSTFLVRIDFYLFTCIWWP